MLPYGYLAHAFGLCYLVVRHFVDEAPAEDAEFLFGKVSVGGLHDVGKPCVVGLGGKFFLVSAAICIWAKLRRTS